MNIRNSKTDGDSEKTRSFLEYYQKNDDGVGDAGDIVKNHHEPGEAVGGNVIHAERSENGNLSTVSWNESRQTVDQETLITNHTSDNPSRNHIPTTGTRKRQSHNTERFNKTLSRDPRWVAHISAAKPRREAAPARLPKPRKRISEQRQIFWPNGPITVPPRRRCCAKKKHIGQMSPLVYCSYPPYRPADCQVEDNDIPELTTSRVVTNGDILALMFYRPSAGAEKTENEGNCSNVDTVSKPSTSNTQARTDHGDKKRHRKSSRRKHSSTKISDKDSRHKSSSTRSTTNKESHDICPPRRKDVVPSRDEHSMSKDTPPDATVHIATTLSPNERRARRKKKNAILQDLCRLARVHNAFRRRREIFFDKANENTNVFNDKNKQ